jgi:hypothetical protein
VFVCVDELALGVVEVGREQPLGRRAVALLQPDSGSDSGESDGESEGESGSSGSDSDWSSVFSKAS